MYGLPSLALRACMGKLQEYKPDAQAREALKVLPRRENQLEKRNFKTYASRLG